MCCARFKLIITNFVICIHIFFLAINFVLALIPNKSLTKFDTVLLFFPSLAKIV